MRWLFIGMVAMALGLVVLGTLGRSADDAPASKLVEVPDRFVEFAAREEPTRPRRLKGELGDGPAQPEAANALAADDSKRVADKDANGEDGARLGWNTVSGEGKRLGGDEGRMGAAAAPATIAVLGPGGGEAGGGRGPSPRGRRSVALDARVLEVDGKESPADAAEEDEEKEEAEVEEEPEIVAMPKKPAEPAERFHPPEPVEVTSKIVLRAPPEAPPPPPSADFGAKLGKKMKPKRAPAADLPPAVATGSTTIKLDEANEASAVCDGLDEDCDGRLENLKGRDLPARIDLGLLSDIEADMPAQVTEAPPAEFLPRMCYFENTYLGGNAAYLEQLRRVEEALGDARPLAQARLEPQAFDPPQDAGIALSASVDRRGLQQPGRVVLQVGLQGSQRYGWRRPPLDVVLVIDGPARAQAVTAAQALVDRLSPRDRLGVIRAGDAAPLAPVDAVRATRELLLDAPDGVAAADPAALARAMDAAGALLTRAAGDAARVPGSQTVILLTDGHPDHAIAAGAAAHRLQVQGAVVSVVDLGAAQEAGWWAVANAGHGNFHRASADAVGAAFDAELSSLSKVVARLLRLNVRLGPQAEGIRVIGSRILGQQEVKAVKAREVATDRNLSKTMGVKADRGDDDDGIQTVIPYFYGGDSHVILVELWVDPTKARPDTAIAEISLKYKDMVNLDNATARTAVYLGRRPAPDTPAQHIVKRNLAGFAFAAALDQAADHAAQSDWTAARRILQNHAATPRDRAVARAFDQILGTRGPDAVEQALRLASRQRKGTSAEEAVR